MNNTSSFEERTVMPMDSKAVRRAGLEWMAVLMREGDKTPERTAPLAMLSAILPAPMKPSV